MVLTLVWTGCLGATGAERLEMQLVHGMAMLNVVVVQDSSTALELLLDAVDSEVYVRDDEHVHSDDTIERACESAFRLLSLRECLSRLEWENKASKSSSYPRDLLTGIRRKHVDIPSRGKKKTD